MLNNNIYVSLSIIKFGSQHFVERLGIVSLYWQSSYVNIMQAMNVPFEVHDEANNSNRSHGGSLS